MALDPVKNFGKVTVSTGYDAAAVSVTLLAGYGAKLPQPSSDGAFNLVWYNATDYPDPSDDPNVEIIRVTARVTDVLTITRAQEGTAASTKNSSGKTYKMLLTPTAKTITDLPVVNPQKGVGAGGAITGTINGSNKIFVAPGRVSVAFVDSSPDDGAAFSYNAGTNQTTITYSVPPTLSIFAF